MRRWLCWLLGHSFICLYRRQIEGGYYGTSMVTGWICQHCGKSRDEQWDSPDSPPTRRMD